MVNGSTGGQYTCIMLNNTGCGNDKVTLYIFLTQLKIRLYRINTSFPVEQTPSLLQLPVEMFNRAIMEFETIENNAGTTLTFIFTQPVHMQYGEY